MTVAGPCSLLRNPTRNTTSGASAHLFVERGDARSRSRSRFRCRLCPGAPFATGLDLRPPGDPGVAAIEETLTSERIADGEYLSDLLANKRPDWEPGSRHGYHAFSLGWYESELLRRTDTEGRTVGRYFATEIAEPLDVEFYIGLPDAVPADRIAEVVGFRPVQMLTAVGGFPWRMVLALANPRSVTRRALSPFDIGTPAELNDPAYRRVEIPSGNGIGRVRDVARVYGLLAEGGGHIGIDAGTFDELTGQPDPPEGGRTDVVLKTETSYSLGYWKPWGAFEFGSPQAFGAQGAGGSFAFADPTRELGFAYAPNRMGTATLERSPGTRAAGRRGRVYGRAVTAGSVVPGR